MPCSPWVSRLERGLSCMTAFTAHSIPCPLAWQHEILSTFWTFCSRLSVLCCLFSVVCCLLCALLLWEWQSAGKQRCVAGQKPGDDAKGVLPLGRSCVITPCLALSLATVVNCMLSDMSVELTIICYRTKVKWWCKGWPTTLLLFTNPLPGVLNLFPCWPSNSRTEKIIWLANSITDVFWENKLLHFPISVNHHTFYQNHLLNEALLVPHR